ncbi:hypothetical protein HEB94_001165 [Actinopolymorpha pittospori]|uniref:Uncharacterized protein n=1 Tax=Actinopolymorpha pittospori TaxID=648752 RepID=A0A927MVZ2_9ACTN|nr:hypothetical protein [Actinopolymorpha pittospori]
MIVGGLIAAPLSLVRFEDTRESGAACRPSSATRCGS